MAQRLPVPSAGEGQRVTLTARPDRLHFEPFVHLVDVDDDQALVAWGGFWFTPFEDGRGWRTLDDEELGVVDPGRTESIGARSEPYGPATVRVLRTDGAVAAEAHADGTNHVWVHGLEPDTEYRYEVIVDGRRWDPEECMSWHRLDDERGELRPSGRHYDLRFRTFPDPERPASRPLTFAAMGDYGIGIQASGGRGRHQAEVAAVLDRLVRDDRLALLLTLGDNIYLGEEDRFGSGGEDDDWYFSYYEPYRFLLARIPVYPTVGNHDTGETEESDDREQLADNHFTDLRFTPRVEQGRDSVTADDGDTEQGAPGLFYRFRYGSLVEFCSLDTSEASTLAADRYFDDPAHRRFLDETFASERGGRPPWLVPFMHHPPFCAGPSHHNDAAICESLVPRFRAAGVRLVLAGHEHNFQHALDEGIHYLVSGAGGKLRSEPPEACDEAHLHAGPPSRTRWWWSWTSGGPASGPSAAWARTASSSAWRPARRRANRAPCRSSSSARPERRLGAGSRPGPMSSRPGVRLHRRVTAPARRDRRARPALGEGAGCRRRSGVTGADGGRARP